MFASTSQDGLHRGLTSRQAKRISTIHHRDIATAIKLALDGVFDRRIVNISDEAPSSIYELVALVGEKLESSAPSRWKTLGISM